VQILLGCKENEFFHRKTCQVFCALFIRGGVVTFIFMKMIWNANDRGKCTQKFRGANKKLKTGEKIIKRLLVAQEELGTSVNIKRRLLAEGFDVDIATDGETALWQAKQGSYAAIILDIPLPKINGYDICQSLRKEHITTPILVLTAKSGEFDEVEAFELGADDYIRKPFSFAVLLARIRVMVQRERHRFTEVLSLDTIRYDPVYYHCWYNNQPIGLTGKEASVLEVLIRARGEVVCV
jgi:DNA-binding response OmpR family regulator